jgi:hypothetical protein
MSENGPNRFTKNLVAALTLIFLLGYTNATVYGVSFTDYFPLDPASYGVKTFQWVYGRTGSFQSYISGTLTVPYTSGAIEGTGIVNFSDMGGRVYGTNDGSEVKWLASDEFYISTDQYLTAHPTGWTFSTVYDDMLFDQGICYFVDHDLTSWDIQDDQILLFDIQNVTVPFDQYIEAVIIWYLDEKYPFTELHFDGTDLDVAFPNGAQTENSSVTGFEVYGYSTGLIAFGDIDAESGELVDLAELVDVSADLDIDWIGMTSCRQFRDGIPQGDYPWSLDIWVHVVDPGALDHIDVTKPDDSDPFVTLYEEDASGWWNCSLDDDYDSLDAVRVVYKEGIYKFDCCDSEDRLIKSLNIAYDELPGEPTGPVEFIYPSMNGQAGISVNPTFTWSDSTGAGDALMTVVDNDEVVYFDAPVSISSTSWTPGPLSYGHEYELDVSVMNIKDWSGGPAFPITTDDTGDTFSYSYMIEYLNEIVFITRPLNDPTEEIEEILNLVDESVEDGTLTGYGPGKSADNRLNALTNMLEEARNLIEEGLYDEACDQLWAVYRKSDGERRPPDFVTGDAANDLADMILVMMDELGCE